MMRPLIALALLAGAAAADAQSLELSRPIEPTDASVEIIGGSKAIAADWPATYVFTPLVGGSCTATAIGPRVLLTAAHCIAGAADGGIKGTGIQLSCEAHPYHQRGIDVALCVTSAIIPLRTGDDYETLELKVTPKIDQPLTLLGYGCTAAGGSAGVLYQGTSFIRAIETDKPRFKTRGGASVCAGDSGGGAFRHGAGDARKLMAVASAALLDDSGISWFIALSNPAIDRFLRDWAGRQRDPVTGLAITIEMCGMDNALRTCHI